MHLLGNFIRNTENRANEVMLHSFSDGKVEWTYGEVNEESNRIANCLIAKGVLQGDVCMICMNDYCKLFITIIAMIKIGAVIVIVDPESPHNLIEYKIKDSGCRYVITDDECILCNSKRTLRLHAISIGYTSGTTGNPKGVYRSIAAFENSLINAEALIEEYGCNSILMSANPWYALYLGLMFPMALLSDGVIYIPDREMMTSLDSMHCVIKDYNIEHCFMSPSYLLNYCSNYDKHNLKLVYTSGDKLRLKSSSGFDVMTQYGQTEAAGPIARAILKTQDDWERLNMQKGSVLGKPILNMQVFILDEDGNQLETNKTGQICVAGPQIGPGYIGQPELNAEKYVESPLSEYTMLRTGDYGYMDESGVLYMTGRNDTVVNINGQRVDTADVEAVIGSCETIKDCRVISVHDKYGENYLVAYCVNAEGITADEVRKYISSNMPAYSVPRYIVLMDRFPLNANGKVDASKFPVPKYESRNYIEPDSNTERKIVRIIADLISADENRIGACDSFDEIGMDSIMFSMLVIRLEDEFSIELTYRDIVDSKDIRTLATCMDTLKFRNASNDVSDVIAKKQKISGPPLSILLECMLRDRHDTAYNNTILIPFDEELDTDRLSRAIRRLINSQEVLHSVFTYDGKDVYRELLDDVNFELETITVNLNEWKQIRGNLAEPFELFGELLYRIRLYRVLEDNNEKYYLMFDSHHSISDQHSMDIFCMELMRFYKGDIIDTVNYYLPYGDADQDNEKYWDEYYEKITSQPDTIADVHRKNNEQVKNKVEIKSFDCSRELTAKLDSFCTFTGFTRANVLLTAYQILIEKYCQHDGFPVAVPFRGRTRYADRNTIGMFVRVLPVVYNYKETIREILLENQLTLSEHQEHQISDLFFRKEKNYQDFVFNYINLADESIYEVIDSKRVRFKQILYYYSRPDGNNEIRIEYDTSAFTETSITRFNTYFNRILTEMIGHTDESSNRIELLGIDEKDSLVNGYTGANIFVEEGTYYECFVRSARENRNRTALIYSSANGEVRVTYGELLDKAESNAMCFSDNYHIIEGKNSLDTIEECFSSFAAGIPFIYLNLDIPEENRKDIIVKLNDTDNNDAVFYLCTSGTTSKSKIIQIDNKGLLNECYGENSFYNTDKHSVVAVTSSPTFDMFYLTALPVLLTGGTLVLFSEEYRKSISEMEKGFKKYCVDRTFMTTRLAEQYLMLVEDSKLKVLLTAGETLNRVIKRDYKLVNGYGPAEVGFITREIIDYDEDDIAIGFPANNRTIYIVDNNNHICPFGVPGEILVGGPRLSTAYIGASQIDNERFIKNVFTNDGSILYRTGDIAYISENGKLYFVGRKDNQIKINGIKVETDTILSLALKVDGVEQAHILLNDNDKYLVLFYVADADKNEQLRRVFKHKLSEPMIPKKYYRIDEMPLTANAKTDESKLRELIVSCTGNEYIAPSTELERELVELVAEVLNIGVSRIGVKTELSSVGCDSLSAMALSYRIEEKYGASINPVVFMRYITIEEVADKIDGMKSDSELLMSYYDEVNVENVPMVFIHTGNTGSEAYLSLAEKLNPGTRFYCIENYNVLHNESRVNGVNNLAEMYCKLIEKIPNNGTFILGGWSYGGIIAHSMAAMMEDKGYRVKLILLDPTRVNSEEARERYEMLKISGQSQEYLKQSPLFEKYREMGLIDVLFENNRYVIQDILDYEPMKCQASCLLFKAMESENSIMDNGFANISGEMDIVPLYTDHDSFMKGEALEIIADKINKIYKKY